MDLCARLLVHVTSIFILLLHLSRSVPENVKGFSGASTIAIANQDDQDLTVMDRISMANKPYNVGYEGDIVLTERDWNVYENIRLRRSAVRQRKKVWPHRVVPYEIEESAAPFRKNILAAIEEFHEHTCITFKAKKNERNWIKFTRDKGCWSYIGRLYWRKGPQKLSLGESCNNKGIIMHELMHAVGFWHEQSRPDRDQYVEVLWENVEEDRESQFNKYKYTKVDSMDFDYDYKSLMHYGKRTFSRNGKPTLRALDNPYMSLGRSVGFSNLDIKKMNALYDCKNEHVIGWSAWSAYTPCNSRCMKYRQRICFLSKSHCPGADSHGIETDRRKCTNKECYAPVDGNWGKWAAWEECDKACGFGKQKRTRTCSDPAPKYGGNKCLGASMQYRMCNMKACSKNTDDCNFDVDYCHWTNAWSSSPSFKWYRHSSFTPSRNTGPTADHTTGKGSYLYIESSYPSRQGYQAQLMSKSFEAANERCLGWCYSMNGQTVGSLNVYLMNNLGEKTLLWSQSGDQGKDWKQAHLSVHSNTQYRIVFEGVRGKGYTGDIAIDDIFIRGGSCDDNMTF